MSKAQTMLEALGFIQRKKRGNYELWEKGDRRPTEEITFNTYDGEQVAKVQTHADKCGPLNCPAPVYEAMLERMRERELGIEVG